MPSSWREPVPEKPLQDYRCKACRRLLFRAEASGRVEIVCERCKSFNAIRAMNGTLTTGVR